MLHRDYIRAMARRSAHALLAAAAVTHSDEAALARVLEQAILDEFAAAAKLREEARALVAAHGARVRAAGADSAALLDKIVLKLARERGVVLR